jgi:tRNA threonylcarbamoyladenosine biosynthesis protein TsaE
MQAGGQNFTQEAMRGYAVSLAGQLKPGDVIALTGDLGAGKTTFTQFIAEGLGCADRVTSPTFTLIHEYGGGRLPLYHFDFYRLESLAELEALGYEEYFYGAGVTVVEWADKFPEALPAGCLRLRITRGDGEDARNVEVL